MTTKTPIVNSDLPLTAKQIKPTDDFDLKKKKRAGDEEIELAKVDEQVVGTGGEGAASPAAATESTLPEGAASEGGAAAGGGASAGTGETAVVSGQSGVTGAGAVASTMGSYGLIGGGVVATAVGLAGGGGAASFIPGLPTVVSKAIQVVDGPLAGAAIFYDTNGNGIADGDTVVGAAGTEFLGFTDSNGVLNVEYTPVPGARFIVVPVGPDGQPAIDTYTGLPFGVELSAEDNGMPGSQVVSPVSTLLATGAVSQDQLRALLGVADDVDLNTFNFAGELRESGAAASDDAKRLAGNAIALGNVLEAVNASLDPGATDVERGEAARLASSIVAGVFASIDPALDPAPSTAQIYGLATQFAIAAVRVDDATVSIDGQPAVNLQDLLAGNTLLNPASTFTFDAAVNDFVQLVGERIEASSQAVVDRIVNATQEDFNSIVNNDGTQQNTNNFLEQLEEQAASDLNEAVTQDAAGTLGLLPDAVNDTGSASELVSNAAGDQLLNSFFKGNLLTNDILFRNPGDTPPANANLKIIRVNGTDVQAATLAPEPEAASSFYLTTSDYIGQTLSDSDLLQTLTGASNSTALDKLVATHPEFVGFGGFDSAGDGSNVDATAGSAVYFDVTVSEGGNITFSFDFTTSDYLPYEDFTFITLTNLVDGQPDAATARIAAFSEVSDVKGPELFKDVCIYVSLSDVLQQAGTLAEGELPSIDVSQVFGITPGTLAAGTYRLGVGVTDAVDGIVNSLMTVRDVTVLDAQGAPTAVTGGVILGNGTTEQTSDLVTTSIQGTLVATTYGVLVIGADGDYVYQVDETLPTVQALRAGQQVTDTFTYTVSNGSGTDTASLTITVTGTNDRPVAVADTASAVENGAPVTGSVATNDTDVDRGDTRTFSLNAPVAGLTLNTDGTFSFDPNASTLGNSLREGQVGTVVANYTVTDAVGATSTSTLTISVTGVNDAPVVAQASSLGQVNEGAAVITRNLNGDVTDADSGDVLTFALAAGTELPAGFTFTSGGVLTFNPNDPAFEALTTGQSQTLSFNYTATDSSGASVSNTVSVTVLGNDSTAPVAFNDLGKATDEQLTPVVIDPVANDKDADAGDVLTFALVQDNPLFPTDGFSINPTTGKLEFDPSLYDFSFLAPGETLIIPVLYTVTDSSGLSDVGTAKVFVRGTNSAPEIFDQTLELGAIYQGSTRSGFLPAFDPEFGSSVVFSLVDPANAPAGFSLNSNGSYSYSTVGDAYAGRTADFSETVTYQVSDGVNVVTGTVTFNTFITNQNPVAVDDVNAVGQDFFDVNNGFQGSSVSGNILQNDTDRESQNFKLTTDNGFIQGQFGFLNLDSSGFYTYQLDQFNPDVLALAVGETMQDVLQYTVRDEDGGTDTGTLTITITGREDGPQVTNFNTINVTEGAITTIDLNTYFTDPEGLPMTFELLQGPFGASISGSNLVISGAVPQYDYLSQGDAGFGSFQDGIRVKATDAAGFTTFGFINVAAIGINDAPVAVNDSGILVNRSGSTFISAFQLTANDFDVDATLFENLQVDSISNVQGGTATLSNGQIEIVANSGSATVSFNYLVRDASGAVSATPATATFTVFDGTVTAAQFLELIQTNPNGLYVISDTQQNLSNQTTVQSLIAELDNIQGIFVDTNFGGPANFFVTADQYLSPGFTDFALKTVNATLTVTGVTSANLAQIYNDGIATTVVVSDASIALPGSAVTDSETGFRSQLVGFATGDTGTVNVNLGDMGGNTAVFSRSVSPVDGFPSLARLFNQNNPIEGTFTAQAVAGQVNVTAMNAGLVAASSLANVNLQLAPAASEESGVESVALVSGGFTVSYSDNFPVEGGFNEAYTSNLLSAANVTIDFGSRAGNAGVNANNLVLTGGDSVGAGFETTTFQGTRVDSFSSGAVFVSHSGEATVDYTSSQGADGISGSYSEDSTQRAATSSSVTLGNVTVDADIWADSISFTVGDAVDFFGSTFTAGSGSDPGPFDTTFGGQGSHSIRLNGSESYVENSTAVFNQTTDKFDTATLSSTRTFTAATSINASVGDGVGNVIMRGETITADLGAGTFNGFNEVVLRGDQVNTESLEILPTIDRTGDLIGSTTPANAQVFKGVTSSVRQGSAGQGALIDGQSDVTLSVGGGNNTFIDARSADVTLTGSSGDLEVRGGSTREYSIELETSTINQFLEDRLLVNNPQRVDFENGDTFRRYLETRINTASTRVDVNQTSTNFGFGQSLRLNTLVSTIALGDVFGSGADNQILVFGQETVTNGRIESTRYNQFGSFDAQGSTDTITENIAAATETSIVVGDGARQVRVVADSINVSMGDNQFNAGDSHVRLGGAFTRTQTTENVNDFVNGVFTSKLVNNNFVAAADTANLTMGDGVSLVRVAALAIDVKAGDQLGSFVEFQSFNDPAGRFTLTGSSTQNIQIEGDFSGFGDQRAVSLENYEAANTISLTGNPDSADGKIDGSALITTAGKTVNIELGSGTNNGVAVASLRPEELQTDTFGDEFVEGFEVVSGSTLTRTMSKSFQSEASVSQPNQFTFDADLSGLKASFTEQSAATAAVGSSFNLVGQNGSFSVEAAAEQISVTLGDAFVEQEFFDSFSDSVFTFFDEGFRDLFLTGGASDSFERFELESLSNDPVTGTPADFVSVESTTITAANSIDVRMGYGSSFVGAFADVISVQVDSALTGISNFDSALNIAFLGADGGFEAILFERDLFGFGSEIVSESLRLNFAAAQQVSAEFGDGDSYILASGVNVDITTGDGEGRVIVGSGLMLEQVSTGDFFEDTGAIESQDIQFTAASNTASVTTGDLNDSITVNATSWTINAGAGLNTVELNNNTGTGTLVIDEHTLLCNDHETVNGELFDVDYTLVSGFGADDSVNTDALGISFADVVEFTSATQITFDNLSDVLAAITPNSIETGDLSVFQVTDSTNGATGVYAFQSDGTAGVTATELNLLAVLQEIQSTVQAV